MTTLLPKSEKKQIVESRLRGLEYKKYALEVDVLIENAKDTPETESIDKMNEAIQEINNQMSVLNTELTAINTLEE